MTHECSVEEDQDSPLEKKGLLQREDRTDINPLIGKKIVYQLMFQEQTVVRFLPMVAWTVS